MSRLLLPFVCLVVVKGDSRLWPLRNPREITRALATRKKNSDYSTNCYWGEANVCAGAAQANRNINIQNQTDNGQLQLHFELQFRSQLICP